MADVIVFVANGFTKDNIRLQPWRYVYELAKFKSKHNKVVVVTEGGEDVKSTDWSEGFTVVETRLLSVKRQLRLGKYIKSLSPDEIWWSTTPRSIAFIPLFVQFNLVVIAFITCPLYRWKELFRASLNGVPFKQSKALWQQKFIPRVLFKALLNSKLFSCVVVQSQNNKSIIIGSGVNENKIHLLQVGIDEADTQPIDEAVYQKIAKEIDKSKNEFVFLYLGALRPIRGFDALLRAFPLVAKKNSNVRLVILARGASSEQCDSVLEHLSDNGVKEKVTIVDGWLAKEEVWSYIELSNIVVLPFLLVPSDIPIAVLESLARGKPVVVSPVDGLPELAEGRGIIVDPIDTHEFSEQLYKLSLDHQALAKYTLAAEEFINGYPRWDDVGYLMQNISKSVQSKR